MFTPVLLLRKNKLRTMSHLGLRLQCLVGVAVFILAMCGSTAEAEKDPVVHGMRIWTSNKGKTLEAKLVAIHAEHVQLEKANGKKVDVKFKLLSEQDLAHLKSALISEGRGTHPLVGNPAAKNDLKKKEKPSVVTNLRQPNRRVMKGLRDNLGDSWPKLVTTDLDVEVSVIEEDAKKQRFVYHTSHYELICDVGLSEKVIKQCAVVFESTRKYCRQLPIGINTESKPGEETRYQVMLFETQAAYVKNGGTAMTEGMSRIITAQKRVVYLPLSTLGIRKSGNKYIFSDRKMASILPRLFAEQIIMGQYDVLGSEGWFTEGLADYILATPYRSGKYIVDNNLRSVKKFVTEFEGVRREGNRIYQQGRGLGDEITAPDLKNYMLQPRRLFGGKGDGYNIQYGMALLTTYYFFHMEKDRSSITNFIKAQKEGKKGEELLNVLLNGRTYDELEKQIADAWKTKGIRIKFK